MFLVIYGIAKTIHRIPGENYVSPMSFSNLLVSVKYIFGSIKRRVSSSHYDTIKALGYSVL
jgi:hypothetical protein